MQLWSNIWHGELYYNKPFYEQAALIRLLKISGEGLHLYKPFHTYLPGGPVGDKYFPHVTVFPHIDFNSNYGLAYQLSDNKKVLRKFNRSKEKLLKRNQQYNKQELTQSFESFCVIDISSSTHMNPRSQLPSQTHVGSDHKQCATSDTPTDVDDDDFNAHTSPSTLPTVTNDPAEIDSSTEATDATINLTTTIPKFIFHAAGRCDKFMTLLKAVKRFRLLDEDTLQQFSQTK